MTPCNSGAILVSNLLSSPVTHFSPHISPVISFDAHSARRAQLAGLDVHGKVGPRRFMGETVQQTGFSGPAVHSVHGGGGNAQKSERKGQPLLLSTPGIKNAWVPVRLESTMSRSP